MEIARLRNSEKTHGHTALYGVTKFSDWSKDEFKKLLGIKNMVWYGIASRYDIDLFLSSINNL